MPDPLSITFCRASWLFYPDVSGFAHTFET